MHAELSQDTVVTLDSLSQDGKPSEIQKDGASGNLICKSSIGRNNSLTNFKLKTNNPHSIMQYHFQLNFNPGRSQAFANFLKTFSLLK